MGRFKGKRNDIAFNMTAFNMECYGSEYWVIVFCVLCLLFLYCTSLLHITFETLVLKKETFQNFAI